VATALAPVDTDVLLDTDEEIEEMARRMYGRGPRRFQTGIVRARQG
jgi:hypothetical protein